MSRPIRHRTPKHRVATSPAENLATPTRRRRSSSGRKWGECSRRMSAAERAEDARDRGDCAENVAQNDQQQGLVLAEKEIGRAHV